MDLPSVCPYCDSELVSYTYRPDTDGADGADGGGAMVFSCAGCGSHVESAVTSFELRAGRQAVRPLPEDPPEWTVVS